MECSGRASKATDRNGDAYLKLGDLSQAEEYYARALEMGYDKFAYLGMARAHVDKGHKGEALKIFDMLLKKEPDDGRVKDVYRALFPSGGFPHERT